MNFIKIAALICPLLLAHANVSAQDYLITNRGDSIAGEIKPLFFGPEKKVQVTVEGKKKTVFSILQTRKMVYKGELYHPVKFDRGYTFMKVVKSGYLSLYAFQPENQVNYDGLLLAKRDGSKMEVPNLTFKKNMTKFLEDCSDVADKIDRGDLGRKNMSEIVDEYNACITTRTVNHAKIVAAAEEKTKMTNPWDNLESKVKGQSDFDGKSDALEMITEIKAKIQRGEKVPNFMVEGLKNSLAKADVAEALNAALAEIKN